MSNLIVHVVRSLLDVIASVAQLLVTYKRILPWRDQQSTPDSAPRVFPAGDIAATLES